MTEHTPLGNIHVEAELVWNGRVEEPALLMRAVSVLKHEYICSNATLYFPLKVSVLYDCFPCIDGAEQ